MDVNVSKQKRLKVFGIKATISDRLKLKPELTEAEELKYIVNMKFTLVCLAFVFGGIVPGLETRFASFNINMSLMVADDSHKLTEDMVRICAQETDLSMDELHKFRQHDFTNSSEATQCFTHCIYEQMGLIRDGVFVERDALRALSDVTDPNYYLIAKECRNIKGTNKCETAYKIHQCRHEQLAKVPQDSLQNVSPTMSDVESKESVNMQ